MRQRSIFLAIFLLYLGHLGWAQQKVEKWNIFELSMNGSEGGWLSNGGTLQGESPARIAFLRQIVENGPEAGLDPIDQYYLTNVAGQYGEYYLYYFGKEQPKEWAFILPDEGLEEGMRFKVDLIDTWNMKIMPVEYIYEVKRQDSYKFVDKNGAGIKLPKKPYMAIRIQRIDDPQTAQQKR